MYVNASEAVHPENASLSEAKVVATPADTSVKLNQFLISQCLLYAVNATRPDIAQAVGVASRFCSKPTKAYLTVVKRILHYLELSN